MKNSDKEKQLYSGYGIAYHGAGLQNFDNDFAKNVLIFGIDNSSSAHTHKYKNNFMVLVKGPFDDSNISVSAAEQKLSINFTKAKIKL